MPLEFHKHKQMWSQSHLSILGLIEFLIITTVTATKRKKLSAISDVFTYIFKIVLIPNDFSDFWLCSECASMSEYKRALVCVKSIRYVC